MGSVLYLRYSKRRYVKSYRRFDRFRMKCFFHEALTYWGYAAPVCIIDNTNLARLAGAGKSARIAPEMEAFARAFGFRFRCHEIGHANRKAGEERLLCGNEKSWSDLEAPWDLGAPWKPLTWKPSGSRLP
jgi:hypothetical protein